MLSVLSKPMSPETSLPSFLTPHSCSAPREDRGPGIPCHLSAPSEGGYETQHRVSMGPRPLAARLRLLHGLSQYMLAPLSEKASP